jgi:hypothetical protein
MNCSNAQVANSQGMELLHRAIVLTDIRQSGPYHIHNQLTATDPDLSAKEGYEDIYFASSQKWRREVRMKGYYEESAIFLNDTMYRARNPNFTPPGARTDVAARMRDLAFETERAVRRVYPREVNGVKTQCVEFASLENATQLGTTWCFDETSGLPMVHFRKRFEHRTEFRNFKPLGEKFVPGAVEMFRNNKSTRKAETQTIEMSVPTSAAFFTPPAGYEARTWCDDMKMPRLESRRSFNLPTSARLNKGLELLYEGTIDEHGNVKTIVAMQPKPVADGPIVDSVLVWRFKPAMCGETPVTTDIMLDAQDLPK